MANIKDSANYEKLKSVLKEVFQLDQADLDFGIYRIMNQKRNEINDFLEKRLLPQVTEILQSNGDGSNTKAQQELDKAIEQANSLGVDPDTLPKVIELRKKLTSTTSVDSLEQEVYSHLANFFKRYYKDGDFISLRRYKKDVYAIPYEGEEVKLHWANHDQYYIKTSEYLKNYGFKLPNGKAVKFELKEASTEQNNNKEQSGKERRFDLFHELPLEVSEDGNILVVNFTYEEHDKKVTQDKLNNVALDTLIKLIPYEFHAILEKRPTDKNKNRTLLEKHILDFTARNSFDYFIHKDLEGFLSREIDFYIKNEVLYLDDINTENEQDFTSQVSKVKAIKQVAQKIITFLSQIENFQKKLWLKKKFVVSTNYCISLDRIPEKYYQEIAENKAQIEEWKRLFKIDKIKGDLLTVKYSEPLSIDFLKSQPCLVLDTKFFSNDFKNNLLNEFDDLDNKLSGLMINTENFQGLSLIKTKFKKKIKCIYIDPPYNTSEETFVYKNLFKHSSWLSMKSNRLSNKELLSFDGALINAIDDEQLFELKLLLDSIYGAENFVANIAIETNPRGRGINSHFATSHDYLLVYAKNSNHLKIIDQPLTEDQEDGYKYEDKISSYRKLPFRRSGGLSTPSDRPNSEFSIIYDSNNDKIVALGGKRINDVPSLYNAEEYYVINGDEIAIMNKNDYEKIIEENGFIQIMPIGSNGERRVWRWSDRIKILENVLIGEFIVVKNGQDHTIQLKDRIKEGRKPKTLWYDSKYDASSHGTNLLYDILGSKLFGYPKSIHNVVDSVYSIIGKDREAITLDFFGGSGTTAQAIQIINKKDNGNRQFIIMEMGEYFNTVTKPRIIKTAYSDNWKAGNPLSNNGTSSFIKYHDLESYEDVLNNLSLVHNKEQSSLLTSSDFKDEYMLSYMLDVEYRDSLLNIDAFKNPFNYRLNITRNNESQETVIDLIETFNYLIGLHVKTMQTIRGFKVITGVTNERDEKTLVIWRNTEEKSNQDLNDFFTKMEFSIRDSEFQRIYVNGDNHLENLKNGEDKWKVVLIEEEFMKRMFDIQDV